MKINYVFVKLAIISLLICSCEKSDQRQADTPQDFDWEHVQTFENPYPDRTLAYTIESLEISDSTILIATSCDLFISHDNWNNSINIYHIPDSLYSSIVDAQLNNNRVFYSTIHSEFNYSDITKIDWISLNPKYFVYDFTIVDQIIIGHTGSVLEISNDLGNNWGTIELCNLGFPEESATTILEANTELIYLYFYYRKREGTVSCGHYISLDCGLSWNKFIANLPGVTVHDISLPDFCEDMILFGTSNGLYKAKDLDNSEWINIPVKNQNPSIFSIVYTPNGCVIETEKGLYFSKNLEYWILIYDITSYPSIKFYNMTKEYIFIITRTNSLLRLKLPLLFE